MKLPKTSLLTHKDKRLIIQQCRNQGATWPEQIAGFAIAYTDAKWFNEVAKREGDKGMPDGIKGFEACLDFFLNKVLEWAAMIEPRNDNGYRKIPVVFQNGNSGIHPDLIERAMRNLFKFDKSHPMKADELYKEFEKIHPFEDGNGRLGHLLWATKKLAETGKWPKTLPPEPDWTK